MSPSQLLSTESQISSASGKTAPFVSSQSPLISTYPSSGKQVSTCWASSPNPSPSASKNHSLGMSSSISPLQSLSNPSHRSLFAGKTVASVSSQSLPFGTEPSGASHASTVFSGSPNPSPSLSIKKTD